MASGPTWTVLAACHAEYQAQLALTQVPLQAMVRVRWVLIPAAVIVLLWVVMQPALGKPSRAPVLGGTRSGQTPGL